MKRYFGRMSRSEQLRSKRFHEKLIKEHKAKLQRAIKDPDSNPGAKNAPNTKIREKAVKGGINTIKRQLRGQERGLKVLNEFLKNSEIK